MNILYIHSDKIVLNDIPWGLVELDENVEIYEEKVTLQEYREEEKNDLLDYLNKNSFQAVIMHDFCESVSAACQEKNIKYISWLYDSPVTEVYRPHGKNSCNYIFAFDKSQYLRLKDKGFQHLYYMPLATNVARNSALNITQEDQQQYQCDISFIGRLYQDNDYDKDYSKLPDTITDYFSNKIKENVCKWDEKHSPIGCIDEKWHSLLKQHIHFTVGDEEDVIYLMEVCYLCRKLAEVERICVLNALALNNDVHLYTSDDPKDLDGVTIHSKVDYEKECPKIYHLSKINLNITLRSIETGIPQRIFDIMSVGGFVLSNYQQEMEELFVPDKEIVLYRDMEELIYKVNYYLKNDKERIQIAMNGYKKVKEYYAYPKVLRKILDIIEA